ncbi:SMI1/KNR4 family protein [Paenibacillus sp. CN-4]|uniref:SMI1/KNR4 family protein n=1 Tax=Paenibacillus nanchangensis TaxID=3348343 RepID=UPI003979AA85
MRKYLLEESEYNTQPPLTKQMIEHAEKTLKVSLPASYLELLSTQYNGGNLRFDGFLDDDEGQYTINEIEGIGEETGGILNSLETAEEWELPEALLPFGGDGFDLYCFDYRECGPHGEPPIIHLNTEEFMVSRLAGNFEEFTDRLFSSYDNYVFGFEHVADDDRALMDKLETVLNCTFKKKESRAKNGIFVSRKAVHPVWTDRCGDLSKLLLYENIRTGNRDYPEYPECNWYMIAMIKKDLYDTLFGLLQDGLPYKTVLIHKPPAIIWG